MLNRSKDLAGEKIKLDVLSCDLQILNTGPQGSKYSWLGVSGNKDGLRQLSLWAGLLFRGTGLSLPAGVTMTTRATTS